MSLKQLLMIGSICVLSGYSHASEINNPPECPPYPEVWNNWEVLKQGESVQLGDHVYHLVTHMNEDTSKCQVRISIKAINHPASPKYFEYFTHICAYGKKCGNKLMEIMRIGRPVQAE